MLKSEIRKDYFLNRFVIIAPKRKKRPNKILKREDEASEGCFFCRPRIDIAERTISQVPNTKTGWEVKVIENKYPALTLDNLRAYGIQEVIVETPQHNIEIHELPLDHIVKIIDTYVQRYVTLSRIKGIAYTLIFKNEGGKAGASVPHSHSQVIALPMIPPKIAEEASAVDDYRQKNGTCPYCDIILAEKNGPRVIWEDEHLFVLSPYASESPYGAWFIPKRHIHSLEYLHENEKLSLAKSLKKVLKRLDDIDVSYNYFFRNSLDCESHHMLLKLSPRPNVWAGLELGTGIIINPVSPEEAVKFYNQNS